MPTFVTWVATWILLQTGCWPGGNMALAAAADDPAAGVFSRDQVFRLEIEITDTDLNVLRGYNWRDKSNTSPRPTVRATVRDGLKTYRDVAVHMKGTAGSFQLIDSKPGLTLNFAKHIQ